MYPNYPYFAVAITRTCGSGGGSYIGKQLAKAFDIDLYDRKLLRLASEDSGISEELFAHADENTRKTMLYRVSERVYDGSIIPPESGNFISDENLFNYQAKVLRELLNEESYIESQITAEHKGNQDERSKGKWNPLHIMMAKSAHRKN